MKRETIFAKMRECESLIQYVKNNSGDGVNSITFSKEEVPLLLQALESYNESLKHLKTDEELYRNTEITYIYREPETNNKTWFTIILKGRISEEQTQEIKKNCSNSVWNFFYPKMVGLPYEDAEHEYEFCFNSVLHTDKPATVRMSVDKLVENFKKAKENDWGLEPDYER